MDGENVKKNIELYLDLLFTGGTNNFLMGRAIVLSGQTVNAAYYSQLKNRLGSAACKGNAY